MKKIVRSSIYMLAMLFLSLAPDAWLWHLGVEAWPLPLALAWWIPTALLVVAELGLQLGMYHKASVRILFSMLLFSVLPKVVFIIFDAFLSWFFAILPSLALMGWFLYGFLIGWKRLEVKYVTYTSPDLPPYFDGYKLLHFSDFHLGTFPQHTDFVQQVVDRANHEDVDLMLFTGDLVNNSATEVLPYMDVLSQLHASDGIYSVWGNHDYCEYDNQHSIGALKRNRKLLYQLQGQLGWHQLMNEHQTISHGLAQIEIIGVENAGQPPFSNRSNLKKAMKGINPSAFKILLTHDPHHWRREVIKYHIQLTLAGHTHAGQIRMGNITPARLAFKEWGGIYRQQEKMMYVSAGLGGSLPFRLGAWPEMTVITLKRKMK